LAQANALAEILETTPAKDLNAAVLNTARQFLSDQNVSTETWSPDEADRSLVKAIKGGMMQDSPPFDQHYE